MSFCRGKAASSAVLHQAVLASRPNESTWEYFRDHPWEATMRLEFGQVCSSHANCDAGAAERALKQLQFLNGKYKTRADRDELPRLAELVTESVGIRGWWKQGAPALLDASDDVALQIAGLVPEVLNSVSMAGGKRHYSLLTKYLHFCLPDTFGIFDGMAARSVEMWSLFAFDGVEEERRRYGADKISDTSGTGYQQLLQFYTTLWRTVSDSERVDAREAAASVEASMRGREDTAGPRVSVLDLVDKLLWKAAGNPIKLGLA